MIQADTIVTVSSWEPRFLLGLERLLESTRAKRVLMYYYVEFEERTAASRLSARRISSTRGIELCEHKLSFGSHSGAWRTIETTLANVGDSVIVDISTMPRETIWATFFWLQQYGIRIAYAYHRPSSYSPEWLARDPDVPRIAFKQSGVPQIGRPTGLVIVTGYDVDRTTQAIEFFQPKRTVLACQGGKQYESVERNIEAHGYLEKDGAVDLTEVDAFSEDHGFREIEMIVKEMCEQNNVIMFSFGPKPTAVALFRIQKLIDGAALGFIHCKVYSEDYSSGIAETICGELA